MICESEERWRQVREWEGLYEVSNMGRVRSLSRWVAARDGRKLVEGRILKLVVGRFGYHKVSLQDGIRVKHTNIHRLVAQSFLPGTGEVVRHLDGDPSNSRVDNLAWGSYKDNEEDKRRHGRVPSGERHHAAVLNETLVRSIQQMSGQGFSQLRIAKELGLNRGVIGQVVRGERWTHVQ